MTCKTERQLKTRISEQSYMLEHIFSRSVITDHRLELEYDFDWVNIEILDKEPCYNKVSFGDATY